MSNPVVRKLDGGTATLSPTSIESLRADLQGPVCLPGDAGYDTDRSLWNAMIDRHPALVVRARNADDVARVIRFAHDEGYLLAVRAGGHNIAGNAVHDNVLVLDLSTLRAVSVDSKARTARVEPGATLADVDRATQEFGLFTPVGINSTTGIAGLTLGGGFGWFSRKYGLTIDNLVAADVVTAKGER